MRIAIAILAITFLAVSSAAPKSARSFAPGHHHAKGIQGVSSFAPGHEKKRMFLQSARTVAPGHLKR